LHNSKQEAVAPLFSKICISVFGRTIPELKERISVARTFNPAFVELRLDYLREPSDLFRLSLNLRGNEIFTFRSRSEGGQAKVSEKNRIGIIEKIISQSGPPFVDIEIAALDSRPELGRQAKLAGSKLICSSHDLDSIESLSRLRRLVVRAFKENNPYAIKIVRKALDFADNRRILSLYNLSEQIGTSKLIAFCAGPLGILSRISCVASGSPFTYVSLPGEATAPGQLAVSTMQKLLQNW